MIDMSSVIAEKYKSNPQVLQAAVLGQQVPGLNIDPYTALSALQKIKEANSMQNAQMAQQPTQQPSMLQDAMQQPRPPRQEAPAPTQSQGIMSTAMNPAQYDFKSKGIAGLPTPDQEMARGGIVAFAEGGDSDSDKDRYPTHEEAVAAFNAAYPTQQYAAPTQRGPISQAAHDLMVQFHLLPDGTPGMISPQSQRASVYGGEQLRRAKGGITHFAEGGDSDSDNSDDSSDDNYQATSTPNAAGLAALQATQDQIRGLKPITNTQSIEDVYNKLSTMAGQSPYEGLQQQIANATSGNQEQFEHAKGYAALAAIPAILSGGNAIRGLGAGIGAFGAEVGKAADAKSKQDQELMKMNINLADAQRKERLGMTKDSVLLKQEGDRNATAATANQLNQIKAVGDLQYKALRAQNVKQPATSADVQAANVLAADLMRRNPDMSDTEAKAKALQQVYQNKQVPVLAAIAGAGARNEANITSHEKIAAATQQEKAGLAADAAFEVARVANPALRKQLATSTPEQAADIENDWKTRHAAQTLKNNPLIKPPAAAGTPAPAPTAGTPAPAPAPAPAKVITQADVDATYQSMMKQNPNLTREEVVSRLQKKGYTIK